MCMSKYKKAPKETLSVLIVDKLSPILDEKQKRNKVRNLLSSLKNKGKIEYIDRFWWLKKIKTPFVSVFRHF